MRRNVICNAGSAIGFTYGQAIAPTVDYGLLIALPDRGEHVHAFAIDISGYANVCDAPSPQGFVFSAPWL